MQRFDLYGHLQAIKTRGYKEHYLYTGGSPAGATQTKSTAQMRARLQGAPGITRQS